MLTMLREHSDHFCCNGQQFPLLQNLLMVAMKPNGNLIAKAIYTVVHDLTCSYVGLQCMGSFIMRHLTPLPAPNVCPEQTLFLYYIICCLMMFS